MTAPRRRNDPAEPTTRRTAPSRFTIDGDCIDDRRTPGRGTRGRSNSPIMLLRWMPVPGTTTPDPEPVELVKAAALPKPSTTEMCVVPLTALPGTQEAI